MGENGGKGPGVPKARPTKRRPRQRPGKKPSPKQAANALKTLERTHRAVELRRRGLSFRAIGAALGCDHKTAQRRVDAALDDMRQDTKEHAARLVELELFRMDRMVEKLERSLNARDNETVARGVRELVRVSASRRRLLGLDQPAKVEVKGRIDSFVGWTDEELKHLAATGEIPERFRERGPG